MSSAAEAELSDDDYACTALLAILKNLSMNGIRMLRYVVKICKHSRVIVESGIFYIACCYMLY